MLEIFYNYWKQQQNTQKYIATPVKEFARVAMACNHKPSRE